MTDLVIARRSLWCFPGPSRATAGPGKALSRGPITVSFLCRDRYAKCAEREETWGGMSPHHPIRSLGERRELLQRGRAEPRLKMDFMHIRGQKEAIWNTFFSIFERWRPPPPKRRGTRGKFPPSPPPLDGPVVVTTTQSLR